MIQLVRMSITRYGKVSQKRMIAGNGFDNTYWNDADAAPKVDTIKSTRNIKQMEPRKNVCFAIIVRIHL